MTHRKEIAVGYSSRERILEGGRTLRILELQESLESKASCGDVVKTQRDLAVKQFGLELRQSSSLQNFLLFTMVIT